MGHQMHWTTARVLTISRVPSGSMEIRDPLHVFVRLEGDEPAVLDSAPFQRLRHIHQLALTYLVYPGATHRRFEHSLGVMELDPHLRHGVRPSALVA